MPVTQVSGKFGGGLSTSFPDVVSRQVGSVTEFMGASLTIGGFVKRVGDAAQNAVVNYVDQADTSTPWQVEIADNTPSVGFWRPQWLFQNAALASQVITSPGVAQDANWHHIALTYAVGGNVLYYLDGVLVQTTGATLTNREPGMGANSFIRFIAGDFHLDDWVITNEILTAAQIASWAWRGYNCFGGHL